MLALVRILLPYAFYREPVTALPPLDFHEAGYDIRILPFLQSMVEPGDIDRESTSPAHQRHRSAQGPSHPC
jgi:hypothetical protein